MFFVLVYVPTLGLTLPVEVPNLYGYCCRFDLLLLYLPFDGTWSTCEILYKNLKCTAAVYMDDEQQYCVGHTLWFGGLTTSTFAGVLRRTKLS